MQTRSIQIYPDRFYHIYNRGNNKQRIFRTDENYRFFLAKLWKYFSTDGIDLFAHCLMPNHFHLGVHTGKNDHFSDVMKSFSISYVKSFHKYHGTSGHLYEDDYQAKVVLGDDAIARVVSYIHLNPWKARLVRQPEDWKYSDCRSWCHDEDLGAIPSLALRDRIFGGAEQYRAYLEESMREAPDGDDLE